MPLEDIIQKERTIYTPLAQEIADSPEEQEVKFKFHVATYVALADMENRWNATLNNLLNGKPATGLIYADTGYGKTSTGASLWNYAEEKGLMAVPPFMWNSLADLLTATHGWVRYRLKDRRPELIQDLEEKYRAVVAVGEETLAQKMSHEKHWSVEQAQEAIAFVKAEERFREELSPPELLDYLRFATKQVLASGYNGLLILPDEFQLFKNNPDTAQNYDRLKQFIFGIHSGEELPLGCIAFTYNETFASIQESEYNYLLARFTEPSGNLINLENLYGETEFARDLWDKLGDLRQLTASERAAIDSDVLDALGQFLRHSRARALMSGPRSVVETFRRAAHHYTEKNRPYSLFNFCEDYLAGNLTYSSQHTEAAQVRIQIAALPDIQNNVERQKLVKLLCVHPEGVSPELFRKYGIPDSDREPFIDTLLPQYVTTKVIGPTLACYRDDLLGVDSLNEILKKLKPFNPTDREVHRGTVRAFHKHVFPEIFTPRKQGTLLGWTGMQDSKENWDGDCTIDLIGTMPSLREYPNRTLKVNVGTEEFVSTPSTSETQLQSRFILDTTGSTNNTCHVTPNGIEFRFDIQKSINPQKIPEDIGKLGDLFSPESITPLLLLSVLDFFDKESTISIVKGAKQEVEVESLTTRIRDELIRYFFSSEVKESVVELSPELASVPAGKSFVEGVLKVLILKQFPDYHAVAISKGWNNNLGAYRDALSKGNSLGEKRGIEPIKGGSKLFNMGQVAFDNFLASVARNLLKVVQISGRREEQDIYFILHPFEELLIKRLENSPNTITVYEKQVNAAELSPLYQDAQNMGYLEEEIAALIETLEARGIVDRKNLSGALHLYLVEKFIDFAEQKAKLGCLKQIVALARANGFNFECENLSAAQALAHTIDENDEVQKDALRLRLNSAEDDLKHKCAEWVKTEYDSLKRKINEMETLRREVPRVLEQTTGYPITEFSTILFQRSVQPEVKLAYTKLSENIRKMQVEIRDLCNREIGTYQANPTPQDAIETATRLNKVRARIDTDRAELGQDGKNAEELFRLFEQWRVLASKIEHDRQLMADNAEDTAVQNFIARLDDVQRLIRQRLADNRMDLKDVLSNHEHFKTQIDEIRKEFDAFIGEKETVFIADKAKIEGELAKVVDTPHIDVRWNPKHPEECHHDVRQKAVEKLKRDVIDTASNKVAHLKQDLLKPIEIYDVPDLLRDKAVQLRGDMEQFADEFQVIFRNLTSENVDAKLSEWVDELVSIRERGEAIFEKWAEIERKLIRPRTELTPNAQRLLEELTPQETNFTELVIRLLNDRSFASTKDVLDCLEELYQGNWVNLTVRGR